MSWAPSPARSCSGCTQQILTARSRPGRPAALGRRGRRPTGRRGGLAPAAAAPGLRPGRRCGTRCRPTRPRSPAGTPSWTGSPPPSTGAAAAAGWWPSAPSTACPGSGKTALAVHAAHLLAGQFPDRQLFIDLHGHTPGQDPVAPEDALAGLLAARRGRSPRPAAGPGRPGRAVAGPDGRPAGAAGPGQRRRPAPRSPRCCPAPPAAWCWSPAAATWPTCPARSPPVLLEALPPGAGPGDVHPAGAPRRRRARPRPWPSWPSWPGTCRWRSGCWPGSTPGTRPGPWPT